MLHGIDIIKHPGAYDTELVLRGPSHQNPAGFIALVNASTFLQKRHFQVRMAFLSG